MVVFSYGIPKSGSTLAFQLATGVALLGGHWQPRARWALRVPGLPVALANSLNLVLPNGPPQTFEDRRLTLAFQLAALWAARRRLGHTRLTPALGLAYHNVPYAQELEPAALPRLIEAAGPRILLVKTHAAPSDEWIAAYRGFAAQGLVRAHVVHRDPRDICLALVDAALISRGRGVREFTEFATLEDAIAGVRRYLAEAARWREVPARLDLPYDTSAFDMDRAIDLLKADLGVACRNDLVRHYATRLAHTQRNKAVPNRHQAELEARERARLTEIFLPELRAGGYPVEGVGQ